MTLALGIATAAGLLIGIAISAFAHSGTGFQTGPLIFLALVISGLGTLTTGLLMFVFGKRTQAISGIGGFFLAMLFALVVLPIIWPYPPSPGPTPLNGESGPDQPK